MACGGCGSPSKIPVKTVIKTNMPTLHGDGSIEFLEGQTILKIQGYEPDQDNERILKPNGVGCSYRLTGIMLDRDGTYKPMHICKNGECNYRGDQVSFDICKECKYRE